MFGCTPEKEAEMYKIGDMVIYGTTGVCKIADISKGKYGYDENALYYVLHPVYEDCIIYAPVDGKVFMRPVISEDEAERLIDAIPEIEPEAYYNNRIQELSQHYKAVIDTHDCGELTRLVMSLHEKKEVALRQNRKLGQVDERFMRQAEELLHGELAAALGMEKDRIPEYIRSRLSSMEEQ